MANPFHDKMEDMVYWLNVLYNAQVLPVQADWNATMGPQQIANKPTLAAVATSGDKADVGLGNVDNTADSAKPISTAQATAIGAKADASAVSTALALKFDKTGGTLANTGGTQLVLDGVNDIAQMAFVDKTAGVATPKKYFRSRAGFMELVNDAYSAIIANISDLGNAVFAGNLLANNRGAYGPSVAGTWPLAGLVSSGSNGGGLSLIDPASGGGVSMWGASGIAQIGTATSTSGAVTPLLFMSTVAIAPATDNTLACGYSDKRWTVVYAMSSSISASDARLKTEVRAMSANEIQAAKQIALEIGFYQFNAAIEEKGESVARLHCGMTVQRAVTIMTTAGLDPMRYGFICYDSWPEKTVEHSAIMDDDGVTVLTAAWTETVSAGDIYSFRYDELNQFIIRGLAANQELLETRIAALESK